MFPRTSRQSLSVPVELVQTVTPVTRRNHSLIQPRKTPGAGLDDYEQKLALGKYESRGKSGHQTTRRPR